MPHFRDDLSSESPEVLQSLRMLFHGRNRLGAAAPSWEALGVPQQQDTEKLTPVETGDAAVPVPRVKLHAS